MEEKTKYSLSDLSGKKVPEEMRDKIMQKKLFKETMA